jgi:Protein kinase domain/PEGA domain
LAAVTTPAGMPSVCARCGATIVPSSTSCPRCGGVITGSNKVEHAERIRLRLQESVGDAYRLLEMLGRGGMGIVFRAHELALDREVALKVLALDPVLSPEAFSRFEREAKLAARLDHPNIVPIFAVGQRHTVAFYTMRLVRGGTLEDMLAGHVALGVEHTLDILKDVARALDYAHGQGVIHRDIKPANVLIGDSGHAMVSDFGIATALGADVQPGSGTGIVGSPGYMSPEQWRGEDLDAKADQYALGVVAFEMLTGHRPFESVKVQDLMRLHLTAEVPAASAIRPGLGAHVDGAIRRAMAKRGVERFPSATAFIEALAGRRPVAAGGTRTSMATIPREGATLPQGPTGGESHSGWAALAVFAVAVSLIAGGTMFYRRQMAVTSVAVSADTAAPAPPVPTDTNFDLDSASQPVHEHRKAVGVDTQLLGGRVPNMAAEMPAYIRIVARGGAGRVRLDGTLYGFTPLVMKVDAGTHFVSLESSGDAFQPSQLTIDAVSDDTVQAIFTATAAK